MKKSSSPDQEALFLEGLITHSRKAYNELYDRYASTLLGIIQRMVHHEEVAQDLLQETFIKVWKNVHRYDPARGRLFTWLAQVARNTALDYLRSTQHEQAAEFQVRMGELTFTDVTLIGLKETVLAALSSQHQPIIEMIYFRGFTHQEVAEQLSLPLGTVKTRVRQALLELKKAFSAE
ncbi:ECF RNA polymerase sigma factor SigK [Larkinella ripae]